MVRVRVVEDVPELAVFFKHALNEYGSDELDVTTTTSHFERLLSSPPWEDVDVAVLDVMLPGVSGLDIARFLREVHPRIRVIVMTASLQAAEEATGIADTVLVKPFATAELLRAMGVEA